jgi:hypothetical protein
VRTLCKSVDVIVNECILHVGVSYYTYVHMHVQAYACMDSMKVLDNYIFNIG